MTSKPARSTLNGASNNSQSVTLSSSESSTESSSEEESDQDSASEEEDDPRDKTPLPAVRPTAPEKAIEYDVIKCTWFRRSGHVQGETLRNAAGGHWTLIKTLRDAWKAEKTTAQEAEGKKDAAKANLHKTRATQHRRTLESGLRATIDYTHQDIIDT